MVSCCLKSLSAIYRYVAHTTVVQVPMYYILMTWYQTRLLYLYTYITFFVPGCVIHNSTSNGGPSSSQSWKSSPYRQDKKEEIWLSPMTKAPTLTEMSKWQSDNTNNATKSSIKQRLRTDLGRSVWVTTATQLVWLTGLRANLPTPRNSRVIKRTYI